MELSTQPLAHALDRRPITAVSTNYQPMVEFRADVPPAVLCKTVCEGGAVTVGAGEPLYILESHDAETGINRATGKAFNRCWLPVPGGSHFEISLSRSERFPTVAARGVRGFRLRGARFRRFDARKILAAGPGETAVNVDPPVCDSMFSAGAVTLAG
jgi:hypothetical protein